MKQAELNRRSFLKASALIGPQLAAGTTCLTPLTACDAQSGWKSIQYPQTLLHNFLLFDGVHSTLQKDKILLLQGHKIIGIEQTGDLSQYKNFRHVDLKGWTLLPGLIDNHVHLTSPFTIKGNMNVLLQKNEQCALNFRNCIMSGVTTARDVGGFPGMLNKLKAKADKNQIPGPRVLSSLSMIAAREGLQLGWPPAPYMEDSFAKWVMGGNFAERPRDIQEINEICKEMIGLGAVWLKTLHQDRSFHYSGQSLPNHTDAEYRAILAMRQKHGIKCALHAVFGSGFKKGVDLGYHTLEHTPMDTIIPDTYIAKFAGTDAAIIPTISIYADLLITTKLLKIVETSGKKHLTPEAITQITAVLKEYIAADDDKSRLEDRSGLRADPVYIRDMYPNVIKNIRKLKQAGARIGIGTDSGSALTFFGFYYKELKHMASAGFSNPEVLRMATAANAAILGMQDKVGTVQKDKWADLIAVKGNPLADLGAMSAVPVVMKGGAFIKYDGIAGLDD